MESQVQNWWSNGTQDILLENFKSSTEGDQRWGSISLLVSEQGTWGGTRTCYRSKSSSHTKARNWHFQQLEPGSFRFNGSLFECNRMIRNTNFLVPHGSGAFSYSLRYLWDMKGERLVLSDYCYYRAPLNLWSTFPGTDGKNKVAKTLSDFWKLTRM